VDLPHGRSLVRTEGRNSDLVMFEVALVSFFVDMAGPLGVPRSIATIYGICFSSAEPLTFSEIQERVHMSSGSISQGLRVLREVGALKAERPIGGRRERFEADLELRKLIARYIERRVEKQLKSGHGRLQAIAREISASREPEAKMLRIRLRSLQNWHNKSRALLPVVKTFLKLT